MKISDMLPASYRQHYLHTFQLGIPIMLGQLGIILVGFADNIMVGQHNADELAAASFVNNFFTLAFITGMGFSYGLTPIIGELFSRHDYTKTADALKNSLVINFCIGILLSLFMLILLFNLDLLNQPEELMPYIIPYYEIQLFSVVFTMLFNSFKQFSDGITDTLTPMWIMLGTNVIHVIGNYILIYGKLGMPEMGLTGAGISTLISRILALVVFVILFFRQKKYKIYRIPFQLSKINKDTLWRLTRLGFPISFQMGVETASFSLSVIMMGWLGKTALAAHQIAGVVTTLGFMIYYGIGAAVTIRVSHFKGQKDLLNIRKSAFAGLHLILFVVTCVIVLLFSVRNYVGYIFTPVDEVVKMTAMLILPVVLYQVGDGLQILFANALRGLSDVKYLACVAFLCHLGLALPIGYICGFIIDWGPVGVWCGFPVSLTTLGILLAIRFNKITKSQSA